VVQGIGGASVVSAFWLLLCVSIENNLQRSSLFLCFVLLCFLCTPSIVPRDMLCGSLEYGIRNFGFYQPECHSNVMEIVALPKLSLPESWPPKPQDSNYIVFGLPPTTQKARIHTVALTLYPIMDVANTLIPSEKLKTASRSVYYDVEPYPWQAQFGGSIIKSVHTNSPKVNLLVAPTGGGKSLVRDVCGLCFGLQYFLDWRSKAPRAYYC
jgi:hypothetical protein